MGVVGAKGAPLADGRLATGDMGAAGATGDMGVVGAAGSTPRHMALQYFVINVGVTEKMFGAHSTPEEWQRRGDDMFRRGLYDVAKLCYRY